ncbi:MerR family transcriptional regulator [Actinomadura welshii]
MRIGDLAARTGASIRSLRYYEEQGLLTSTRSAGGQRHYTDAEVERVKFLQRLYAGGLSSSTIAEILPCAESPSTENFDAALERLARERDRLSEHITDLMQTLDHLDALMAVAREHRETQQDPRVCEIDAAAPDRPRARNLRTTRSTARPIPAT